MKTKLDTVKIGNYFDVSKDVWKKMGVDLEEEDVEES